MVMDARVIDRLWSLAGSDLAALILVLILALSVLLVFIKMMKAIQRCESQDEEMG